MRCPTVGEKLAQITTLSARSGIRQTDYHDMRQLSEKFDGAPEKACIVEFTEKEIERVHAIYRQFFEESTS